MKRLSLRFAGLALSSVLWVTSVPARADLTHGVYRPTTGEWFYHRADGTGCSTVWGAPGDLPVPANYLSVGGPEIAVYRPSTGEWFIRYEDGTGTTIQWGAPGDVPMPGDYYGTGRAQIAVWRPSTGQWFVRKDDATAGISEWGCSIDIPVLVSAAPVPAVPAPPPATIVGSYGGSWDAISGNQHQFGVAQAVIDDKGNVTGTFDAITITGAMTGGKFLFTLTYPDGGTDTAQGTFTGPSDDVAKMYILKGTMGNNLALTVYLFP